MTHAASKRSPTLSRQSAAEPFLSLRERTEVRVTVLALDFIPARRGDSGLEGTLILTFSLREKELTRSHGLAADGRHPDPNDPVDQLRIRKSRLPGRLREVFIGGQDWVWIRFDEIKLVVRRQPQVDARVAFDR